MPNLNHLDLSYTKIDDYSIKQLEFQSQIQNINLSKTNVTTECLYFLRKNKNLKYLNLGFTKVDGKICNSMYLDNM